MFITTLFTVAKTWKQPKCPVTVKQIKKISLMILLICRTLKMIGLTCGIYRQWSITGIKKNKILPFAAIF